jgi:hypothetical protein
LCAGNGYYRACDVLRKVCKQAEISAAERMKCTLLRKYTATVSQLLALQEHELEWLCGHMGHSITVHRNFYRLYNFIICLDGSAMAIMSKL